MKKKLYLTDQQYTGAVPDGWLVVNVNTMTPDRFNDMVGAYGIKLDPLVVVHSDCLPVSFEWGTMLQTLGVALVDPNLPTWTHTKPVEGHHCTRCNDYVPHSEPNQPNGTFKCFVCRQYSY